MGFVCISFIYLEKFLQFLESAETLTGLWVVKTVQELWLATCPFAKGWLHSCCPAGRGGARAKTVCQGGGAP